ncbi:carbamoyltransferase HypF [Nodosilinea sp. P-1105]|uniref:carbamoyltransferase HypF n=1 Tax=Nodosilinea sp. P-1105 TaxID=2546229 RepID=UPI001982095E|nr:carbamoyltransferase HypF [Nodosilinea sp. P-1105]
MGTVQGVGFRPTVYRLASALGLRGTVLNDGLGVLITVAGNQASLDQLVIRLLQEVPPLAKITCIQRQPLAPDQVIETGFSITASVATPARTEIAPDAATCPQCQAEIGNPLSRYFRYPFTNCTHCGPRLSIIQGIPYDRANTSMAWFPMCHSCRREYQDVDNRRFHAQPVACPVCGPKIWLERADGKPMVLKSITLGDELEAACNLLQRGEILAIKGLGGVHLACDATNETAVARLRQRKGRYHKPLALMVRDLAIIEPYCHISDPERQLLESPAAPIVLLRKKEDRKTKNEDQPPYLPPSPPPPLSHSPTPPLPHSPTPPSLAPSLAPGLHTLGVMLPYTPLHHLILQCCDRPIVMTSGNRVDEPQCISNEEVRSQLSSIATYFVLHNRDIVNRVDDSVVRVTAGVPQVLRRARGYAPAPIQLPAGFESVPPILAMGSELKNTFCLLRSGQAILAQHLGDLGHAAAYQSYGHSLGLYQQLFQHQPQAIALDGHPEYRSTKLGHDLAQAQALPTITVQHHHAHIAACLADNGVPLVTSPVLGIALDGLGYGDRQDLWGGEFLLADYRQYRRLAHLKPIALLGGAQAIRQPWRNTYAQLVAAFGDWETVQAQFGDVPLVQWLDQQPLGLLDQMVAQDLNTPLASSMGRLFDAVAAALGMCRETASYEGQGAVELESLAATATLTGLPGYPFQVAGNEPSGAALVLDPGPLWPQILADLQAETPTPAIAAKFHIGLAEAIATLASHLCQRHQLTTVALSGGVWQNQLLTEQVCQRLTEQGVTVLTHHHVPPNDGGLSLGQAVIAAAQTIPP